MKKIIYKILALFLIVFSVSFSGCSNGGNKNLDLSFYLASSGSGTFYYSGKSSRVIKAEDIYNENLNYDLVDEYYSISFTSSKSYMYKMYIDYIEIGVYTNQALDSQMDIRITITNMANKDSIKNRDTFETGISLYPKENKTQIWCNDSGNHILIKHNGCIYYYNPYFIEELKLKEI